MITYIHNMLGSQALVDRQSYKSAVVFGIKFSLRAPKYLHTYLSIF